MYRKFAHNDVYWKDKNNEKGTGNGPFKKKGEKELRWEKSKCCLNLRIQILKTLFPFCSKNFAQVLSFSLTLALSCTLSLSLSLYFSIDEKKSFDGKTSATCFALTYNSLMTPYFLSLGTNIVNFFFALTWKSIKIFSIQSFNNNRPKTSFKRT